MGKDTTEKLKKYIKEDRPSRFKSFVRKRGIDVCDVQLNKGQNLLHYTCKYGRDIIFSFLMKTSVNFSLQDEKGNTPLHLALKQAIKATSNTVYTSIVLPLLEKSPDLLEVTNQQGLSCRDLLDKLVQKRQTQTHEEKPDFCEPETCDEPGSWEEKLAEEFRNEQEDYSGRYKYDQYENDEKESYGDWADRLRREYHLKNRNNGHRHSNNKRETTSESQSHDKNDSKERLEDIRKKLRKKYEENQKRDRANRILMKSKNYLRNSIALQSGTDGIKCNDIPWPYSVDVVEIKNVMFHDVLTDDHKYKKRLREEQIRWHPDKFLQKYGQRLCECDRNGIMEKVKEISQELNRLSDLL